MEKAFPVLIDAKNPVRFQEILEDYTFKLNFSDAWLSLFTLRTGSGDTLLLWAITEGYDDLARTIIDAFPTQNLATRSTMYGDTALHRAIENQRVDIATLLIEKMSPSDLALKTLGGQNALMRTIARGLTDITLPLIAAMNADDLGAKDNKGYTALMDTALHGREVSGEALARKMKSAHIAYKNNDGKSALDIARTNCPELYLLLEKVERGEENLKFHESQDTSDVPDTAAMIKTALETGNASDAAQVGRVILDACTEFAASVQQLQAQSVSSSAKALHQYKELSEEVANMTDSLLSLTERPERLHIPEGVTGKFTLMVRKFLPRLDPYYPLQAGNSELVDTIKESMDASLGVMKSYEDFQKHYPRIREELDTLRASLQEALTIKASDQDQEGTVELSASDLRLQKQ
ncbi:MAG: hypothetical protein DI551_10180, partial [Micavibrio aeruginosavorus]